MAARGGRPTRDERPLASLRNARTPTASAPREAGASGRIQRSLCQAATRPRTHTALPSQAVREAGLKSGTRGHPSAPPCRTRPLFCELGCFISRQRRGLLFCARQSRGPLSAPSRSSSRNALPDREGHGVSLGPFVHPRPLTLIRPSITVAKRPDHNPPEKVQWPSNMKIELLKLALGCGCVWGMEAGA